MRARNLFRIVAGLGEQKRALGAEIDVFASLVLEFVNELRIHLGAGGGEGLQDTESVVAEHSSGCVGGLAAGLATFDHEHGCALLAKVACESEPDDAAADDEDVPGLHSGIVKDRGGVDGEFRV